MASKIRENEKRLNEIGKINAPIFIENFNNRHLQKSQLPLKEKIPELRILLNEILKYSLYVDKKSVEGIKFNLLIECVQDEISEAETALNIPVDTGTPGTRAPVEQKKILDEYSGLACRVWRKSDKQEELKPLRVWLEKYCPTKIEQISLLKQMNPKIRQSDVAFILSVSASNINREWKKMIKK